MIPPRPRILFFDDDEDIRDMTSMLLNEEGFEMVGAKTAGDLLELAQMERFDGYMLDNWMPDLSGMELCQRIREFDDRTPIVFYSGANSPEDQVKALAVGAQAYIAKPEIEELMDALRLVVSESKCHKTVLTTHRI
jgi:DNA-binding response OmpR family regulator